jgi:hypothetical protein
MVISRISRIDNVRGCLTKRANFQFLTSSCFEVVYDYKRSVVSGLKTEEPDTPPYVELVSVSFFGKEILSYLPIELCKEIETEILEKEEL